jgi:putative tryptophan/tyrosine transport system substrate-binding protein
MKRRTFLAGVVTVASLPRSLAAQTAPKVVRIGWLTAQQASSLTPYLEALRAALAELGYAADVRRFGHVIIRTEFSLHTGSV